jgi:hypothetical protein
VSLRRGSPNATARVQLAGVAVDEEERSPCGHEGAERWDELEHAVGRFGLGDERVRPDHRDEA